ncbi:DUF1015 domain-containing protein [Candidatus Nephthysia bennettiae]|uniref:DUF1015 domain-containing protein n=1 Tax=Candidatus Nephthysia bennettiae TaxID=3127016 RepID=A0A934N857_9BACT|nr:DUF1015 domain-containing protein [Candidatus Dormibacteraeota bacterium]MBJ7612807.1 DUF1015 domain-containing protein [Candidatus Dormibacteraeota bacterium]
MADVRPLPGLRYAEPLEPVLAPPYDVLSDEQVAQYRARSPHNVVHLTRPGDDYEGAARLLREWIAAGFLREESGPRMYVHRTEFEGRTRTDLMAALRLQPYEDGAVLPHERTHRGPREDRLALMRATGASLEPLWFLADELLPLLEAAPDGEELAFEFGPERHTLRAVPAGDWTASVRDTLARAPVLIADGHHRYETTLAYSREIGGGAEAASRFTLALLTDVSDPGLVVLPTHRLLKAGVSVIGGEPVGSLPELLEALRGRVAAGTYRGGEFQVLPLEGEVSVLELHRQVIDNVLGKRAPEDYLAYTRDPEEAVDWVDSGDGVAAFFLDKPDLSAVLKVAREGRTLPQKTTYFDPKPPSGMLFHLLDPGTSLP